MKKTLEVSNKILFKRIKKYLLQGYSVTITLKGNSMMPYLQSERDKVVLECCDIFHVGDLVLAETNQKNYILHRIIKINNTIITLKGDGNIYNIEHLDKKNIIAKVIGFYRKGNNQMECINSWKWICFSFLWPKQSFLRRILLYIYIHIFNHPQKIEREKNENKKWL